MPICVHARTRTHHLRKQADTALALNWKGKRRWGYGHMCVLEYEGYGGWRGRWPLARVALSLYMGAQLIAGPVL